MAGPALSHRLSDRVARPRALIVLALVATTLALALPLPGSRADEAEREAALAEIREQIASLQGRLDTLRSRESTLEDQLESVSTELALQQARLDEATAALALAQERIDATETRIVELESALEGVRSDLRRRLVGLHRLGRQGYLRLFLALEPESDEASDESVLSAVRQLRFLVLRDRRALDRFTALREDLGGERERLEAERREAEIWTRQERERRDDLRATERRHRNLLARVAEERRRVARRADALAEKERKLVRLLDRLADEVGTLEGEPIQGFRGVLDWPAPGEVVGEFGTRRDPRYQTEVPHNGFDLATEPGREVRAVYSGEVLYAEELQGYGPMVIVLHPGRVFTLYGGLGRLGVEKGDVLTLGDAVGAAGEVLYFEIRVEGEPKNPREWLR